jgi:hypothetical protein
MHAPPADMSFPIDEHRLARYQRHEAGVDIRRIVGNCIVDLLSQFW